MNVTKPHVFCAVAVAHVSISSKEVIAISALKRIFVKTINMIKILSVTILHLNTIVKNVKKLEKQEKNNQGKRLIVCF